MHIPMPTMANQVNAPYRNPQQAGAIDSPRDQPAAAVEIELIANIIGEIHKHSERIDLALDRLSGGRPQAVNAGSGATAPPANSILSRLIVVREALGQHLADMSDHAARIEKFV